MTIVSPYTKSCFLTLLFVTSLLSTFVLCCSQRSLHLYGPLHRMSLTLHLQFFPGAKVVSPHSLFFFFFFILSILLTNQRLIRYNFHKLKQSFPVDLFHRFTLVNSCFILTDALSSNSQPRGDASPARRLRHQPRRHLFLAASKLLNEHTVTQVYSFSKFHYDNGFLCLIDQALISCYLFLLRCLCFEESDHAHAVLYLVLFRPNWRRLPGRTSWCHPPHGTNQEIKARFVASPYFVCLLC